MRTNTDGLRALRLAELVAVLADPRSPEIDRDAAGTELAESYTRREIERAGRPRLLPAPR